MTKADLKLHRVEVLDRGLAYGEACFETFRAIDGEVLALDRHFERLATGVASFGIDLDGADLAAIADAALVAANEHGNDVLVRVTVTGGTASWGLMQRGESEAYIQCQPYKPATSAVHLESVLWPFPLMRKVAKFTADYALSLRALQQWRIEQNRTPLICRDGFLLSSLTANVLILHDGQWFTPDGSAGGVLPGIVRELLIEKGIAEPSACPVEWLDTCEAMMLTNSSLFAAAVSSINGRELDAKHSATFPVLELLKMYPGVEL